MKVKFMSADSDKPIAICSHDNCPSISKGDTVIIHGQHFEVNDKIYVDPQINGDLLVVCTRFY